MRYSLAVSALLALAAAGAAHAQESSAAPAPGGPMGPGAGPGMGLHAGPMGAGGRRGAPGLMLLLRAADTDRDGSAAWREVAALEAEAFAWRDRNGDGVLNAEDAGPAARRLAELRSERPDDPWMRPRRGAGADREVTQEDALARVQEAFAQLDADGDGAVTAEEARSARPERPRGFGGRR